MVFELDGYGGCLRPSLPELKGTEERVIWAREIRQRMLMEAEDYVSGMTAPDADRAKLIEDFREALAQMRTRRSAMYWIDLRNVAIEDVLFNEAYMLPKPRGK